MLLDNTEDEEADIPGLSSLARSQKSSSTKLIWLVITYLEINSQEERDL